MKRIHIFWFKRLDLAVHQFVKNKKELMKTRNIYIFLGRAPYDISKCTVKINIRRGRVKTIQPRQGGLSCTIFAYQVYGKSFVEKGWYKCRKGIEVTMLYLLFQIMFILLDQTAHAQIKSSVI